MQAICISERQSSDQRRLEVCFTTLKEDLLPAYEALKVVWESAYPMHVQLVTQEFANHSKMSKHYEVLLGLYWLLEGSCSHAEELLQVHSL